jgi:hypothetical protein
MSLELLLQHLSLLVTQIFQSTELHLIYRDNDATELYASASSNITADLKLQYLIFNSGKHFAYIKYYAQSYIMIRLQAG